MDEQTVRPVEWSAKGLSLIKLVADGVQIGFKMTMNVEGGNDSTS